MICLTLLILEKEGQVPTTMIWGSVADIQLEGNSLQTSTERRCQVLLRAEPFCGRLKEGE